MPWTRILACLAGVLLCGLAVPGAWSPALGGVRIKDVVSLEGARGNQLVGYGLVIGLNGTGDSLRNSPFTEQSIAAMLERIGVNVRGKGARTRNVAAVIVTADLPPYVGVGSRVDVTVSSLGDATSLSGGSLIRTPLFGADNEVYAVAQGGVAVSGFDARGQAEAVTSGVPTSGRIANGAYVERPSPGKFTDSHRMRLELFNPDFSTVARVTDAINRYTRQNFGRPLAQAMDMRVISVEPPPGQNRAFFMAAIGELEVTPDTPARIVIDERTGTIVIGSDVRVSTVAVTHGNITVRVTESPQVSQPLPFSNGETVVVPQTQVDLFQPDGTLRVVRGTDLQSLVAGLNRMGLRPTGIIAVIQAIKSAGALHAELVVQ